MSSKPKRKVKSTKYAPGTVHQTSQGPLRIIENWGRAESKRRGFSNTRAIVEFIETGYVANVQVSNIPADKVKDRRRPSVYGVGFIGSDIRIPSRESGSEVRRAYDVWANMLKRCYGDYDDYSYDGVVVDKRWHSFTNFLNSLPKIPGYELWVERPFEYQLDKDIRVPGSKVYSLDTCSFVTIAENMADCLKRRWGKN